MLARRAAKAIAPQADTVCPTAELFITALMAGAEREGKIYVEVDRFLTCGTWGKAYCPHVRASRRGRKKSTVG